MKKRFLSIGLFMMLISRIALGQVGWYELGTGNNALNLPYTLWSVAANAAGNVYVAGPYDSVANSYIAWWNGSHWSELGTGANALNANDIVRVVSTDASGNVYAAGDFVNNNFKLRVAKWNGSTWADLDPNSLNGLSINSLQVVASDNIYAAGELVNSSGEYYVAHWNGTTWTELGAGAGALKANLPILALARDGSGNLYAAGQFTNSTGAHYVAKWNGTTWSELGSGAGALNANAEIQTLTCDAAGNVYAAGNFTNSVGEPNVAKWNGTSWAELGTGSGALHANNIITELGTDGAGNVYAAGSFFNISNHTYVAKWNGSAWSELGSGLAGLNGNQAIHALHVTTLGTVYAGGDFSYAGSNYIAVYDGKKGPKVDSITVRTVGSVPANIAAIGGTLPVKATVYPLSVNDSVSWSIVPGTGTASLSFIGVNATITGLSNGTVWAKAVSVLDPAKKDSLLITVGDPALSVNDLEKSIALDIYPNPAKDLIHIRAGRDHPGLSAVLTDGLGRTISSRLLQANSLRKGYALTLDHLAPGVYYLTFSAPGIYYSHKIAKE